MKKFITYTLLLTFLFSLAGCCATTGKPAEKAKKQKVTVILDWVPNTNHTGLYVARDKGYYAEEGLDVEIIQPADGGTAQLISAGQGDFGISYQEELTIARSQNLPVVALAAVIQHNTSGFASPADKNIKTPKDFEGKTYGGWGSPAETAMLKSIMDKYHADFSKVKVVNIGAADFFTSVEKDIDFSWIFYGWTGIEAEQRKMNLNFIKLREEDPALDFYTPLIITNESKISKDPELVKKFMKATSRGYEDCITHPNEAAEILVKAVPELDQTMVKASQAYLSNEYQSDAPRWGEMKASVWTDYAEFMHQNGLIKKQIDTSKAFTNDFLPEK